MIVLLGETTAARKIAERLKDGGIEFKRIQTWTEKAFLQTPSVIVDASHPSCSVTFAPLRQWCEQQDIPYLRLERPETKIPVSSLIYPVYNWEEALLLLEQRVDTLYQEKGLRVAIFVTTGSHQLESILFSSFARFSRVVVRVLPEGRLVQKCQELGIHPRDIVAMQGPFSKEINKALFKFYGADILLTRDSGLDGGTDTKMLAALELGLEIVLIKKIKANSGVIVYNINELMDWIDNNIRNKR